MAFRSDGKDKNSSCNCAFWVYMSWIPPDTNRQKEKEDIPSLLFSSN